MTDTSRGLTASNPESTLRYSPRKAGAVLSALRNLGEGISQSITTTGQGEFEGSSATSATPVSARLSLTEKPRTAPLSTFSTSIAAGCPIHWWNKAAPMCNPPCE
jgi:hypothetical protein